MINDFNDDDIRGILQALQEIRDADTLESGLRVESVTRLDGRIDSLVFPQPGDLHPNVLQLINFVSQTLQTETENRIASHGELVNTIAALPVGADPADVAQNTIDIADIQTQLTSFSTLISDNANAIATETADRIAQYNDVVTPQFVTVNDSINDLGTSLAAEVDARSTADAAVSDRLDAISVDISDVNLKVANEESIRASSVSSVSDQISALSGALAIAQQQILKLSGIGVDSSGALSSQLIDLTYKVNGLQDDLNSNETISASSISSLQSNTSDLNDAVSFVTDNLTTEVAARIATDNDLQIQVTSQGTLIDANAAAISAETSVRSSSVASINLALGTLSGTVATLASGLTDETIARETLATHVDSLQVASDTFNSAIAVLQTDVNLLKTEYLLSLDGDGNVQGYQRGDGTGASSTFPIVAENFELVSPVNPPVSPFVVTSEGLVMSDTRLSNASLMSGSIFVDGIALANSSYPDKSMASQAYTASELPSSFVTGFGVGPENTFQGSDDVIRTITADVYTDDNMLLHGVDFGSGFESLRLGSSGEMAFRVFVGGVTNSSITVWYRVKDNPPDAGMWIFAGTMEHGIPFGARDYERAGKGFVFTATVGPTQVIEFGMNALNGLGLPVDPANDTIYQGWISVSALNL